MEVCWIDLNFEIRESLNRFDSEKAGEGME